MTTDQQKVWTIEPIGGARYAIRNVSGQEVTDIQFSLTGAAVIYSSRDWTHSMSVLADGDAYEFKYQKALGAETNPPFIHAEFHSVHDGVLIWNRTDVELPL